MSLKQAAMKKQDFINHRKYYIPHHFIFYPVLFILIAICTCFIFKYPQSQKEWGAILIILILIGWLSVMLRQHYALTLQNRTVRLEMRLRYYQLTQRRLEFIEYKLSFDQLAALRFSSDDQLSFLITEAIDEKLTPTGIKRRIKDWRADDMRV